MLLVTTPLQQTWGDGEKILFLGEWCRRYSQREIWEKLDFEVAPYHWNNRQQFNEDYDYLQDVYERYLKELSVKLNEFHQVHFSLRYWRILVGPWLNWFISILYDRFQSIETASQSFSITHTKIQECPNVVPKDMKEYMLLFATDSYNHYLYGEIIRESQNITYELLPASEESPARKSVRVPDFKVEQQKFWKKEIKSWLKFFQNHLFAENFIFVESQFSTKQERMLKCVVGEIPISLSVNSESPDVPIDWKKREQCFFNSGKTPFEQLLSQLLFKQIPLVYLEGYSDLWKCTSDWPQTPKLIYTVHAYDNDVLKCWMAEQCETGTKLVVGQHGGLYGTALRHAMEDHEICISDRYMSWGWNKSMHSKVMMLPASKILTKATKLKPDPTGKLLWCAMTLSRYSYWMYSGPVASEMLTYWKEQQRFIQTVSPDVHRLLLLRLYPNNTYGWDELEFWQDFDHSLEVYQGSQSMDTQLNQSRLFIGTYNATTYLETFAANFPTVLFWNPKHWELRLSAAPYFEKLRTVGILHDTPESAAALVNEIVDDPQTWWKQPEIQKVKNEFCQQFAHTSAKWLWQWRRVLISCKNEE